MVSRVNKKIKGKIVREGKDVKDIWRRIKTRNFSGNTGLAIKNSLYQFSTNFLGKIGSFIFVIIVARLLMPELFGLYSLALSIILIFGALSELGIETTLTTFISKEFERAGKKLRAIVVYLGKIKVALTFLSALVILVSAEYVAHSFYQKPIFLAMLAGILYISFNQLNGFLKSMLYAANNFSSVFKREFVFQASRIIIVPLAVIFAIKYALSDEVSLMIIILLLSLSFLLASLLMLFDLGRIYRKKFALVKPSKLSKEEKKEVDGFIVTTAALVLSGVFFGNIDKVMLGFFVSGEFIGYYTVAFSLIGAIIALAGFGPVVLLPIFSRLKGKRLEEGFKKSAGMILLFSGATFLATLVFAYLAVLIIYGKEYLPATNILRIMAPLLFAIPVISIYRTYFISQGNPQIVAKLLIVSTALNVALNYLLITYMLSYGSLAAVYGAAVATLISQFFYLGGLIFSKRKK